MTDRALATDFTNDCERTRHALPELLTAGVLAVTRLRDTIGPEPEYVDSGSRTHCANTAS